MNKKIKEFKNLKSFIKKNEVLKRRRNMLITPNMILSEKESGKSIFRQQIRQSDKKLLFDSRIEQARDYASILYRYGAKRVWLFGSLAEMDENRISDRTDIDLAVDDMNYKKFISAKSLIQKKANCKVDIVMLNKTNPGFRSEIVSKRIFIGK